MVPSELLESLPPEIRTALAERQAVLEFAVVNCEASETL